MSKTEATLEANPIILGFAMFSFNYFGLEQFLGNILVGTLLIIWGLYNVRKWTAEEILNLNSLIRFIFSFLIPFEFLLAVYKLKIIYDNFYVFGVNIIVLFLVIILLIDKKRKLVKIN
ncbi:hypothetical protein JCM14036_12260 [Desulfotomaculum defluvii]